MNSSHNLQTDEVDKLELIFSTISITRRRVCFMHNSLFPGAEKDRLDLAFIKRGQ